MESLRRVNSVQLDTRLRTADAAIEISLEAVAGASVMTCTMVDDVMGDRSSRCPKKSISASAEVLRAEINCLWHSVLPTFSERSPLEI